MEMEGTYDGRLPLPIERMDLPRANSALCVLCWRASRELSASQDVAPSYKEIRVHRAIQADHHQQENKTDGYANETPASSAEAP